MPELDFRIAGVEPVRHAAAPALEFRLAITQSGEPVTIQSIALQCQIRIDARRRRYGADEQARLTDLFGEPDRWSQTLNNMFWTHASVVVPPFSDRTTTVSMPVPCTFDFNIAATKYFHGVRAGDVPLVLLFSGSVFYRNGDGRLEMDLISWNKEASFRLPVSTWQQMMDIYYPNRTWLSVDRELLDALYAYKRAAGLTSFDEALARLLPAARRAKAS